MGHEAIAFCRSGKVTDFEGECHPWTLGRGLDAAAIAGAECAIHLAHDFGGAGGAEQTLAGILAAVRQLQQAGVRRQLLYSSYSAGPHAASLYGRTKSALEAQVLDMQDVIIVRPGLVLGAGGLFGRIRTFARLSPLVPLPDGGVGKVPVIEIGKLCDRTLRIAVDAAPLKVHNVFEPELISLRDIVLSAAREAGRSPWIIPVPSKLVLFGLHLSATLHLPLPVNADNLSGFLANQSAGHVSTLESV